MFAYIARRLLILPVMLIILSFLIFSLVMFLSPYERLAVFVPSPEAMDRIPTEVLLERYGLDQPFYVQYFQWAKGAVRGQFGYSASASMPVAKALAIRFPATLELIILGNIIIISGAIILGIISAVKHNKFSDHLIRLFTIFGMAMPGFVFGLLFLVIFYSWLGWFPPGRLSLWATDIVRSNSFNTYTGMMLFDSVLNWRFDIFVDSLRHLILPSLTFSFVTLSIGTRLVRSSLLQVLKLDYIMVARAKGLKERMVIQKHALRNALLPLITFMGTRIPIMFGGVVVIETVFNYPGMGRFIVNSAQGLDFISIIGASLLIGFIIIVGNLIIDISYSLINPIIRYN